MNTYDEWRKSSRSGSNGGQCVELSVTWRKSSHSGSNRGERVEVTAFSLRRIRGLTLTDPRRPGRWRGGVLARDG
jgi:Domain of unknown function (DUF397)